MSATEGALAGGPTRELGASIGAAPVRRFAVAVGGAVAVFSIGVLIGWAIDNPVLKAGQDNPMRPNTAVALILLGAATIAAARGRALMAQRLLALLAAAIGLVTLVEYGFAVDAHVDQLLFSGVVRPDEAAPGRMAPATAFCLVLLGAAIGTRAGRLAVRQPIRDALVLLSLALSYLATTGYVYGTTQFYGITPGTQMALSTSLSLFATSVAVLALDPDTSVAAILLRPTAGGLVARRFIPLALIGIPLLGWIRLRAQEAGWYDTEFGMALMVVTVSTLFVAMTGYVAWRLDHAHVRRVNAEASAMTDALTGLGNRRFIDQELARLDGIAQGYGEGYAVLAIDADDLKRVNDTYGHGFGDLGLRRLADTLTATLRDRDVAARVGGDEFLAVLPGADRDTARAVATRLGDALRAAARAQGGAGLTASIGLSAWSPGLKAHDVLADADRDLYRAKHGAASSG